MTAHFDDNFQVLDIWELFDLIKKAKMSKQAAVVARGQEALEEFRRRYQKHVTRFVRSARSRILCSVCAEDVVEGVFDMVWDLVDSFRHEPGDDEKAERYRICRWLGSPICQNLVKRLNDKELLVCALRRDEGDYERGVSDRTFAEFVRRHVKRLRWQCSRFTWGVLSEMEVEELVQETFLKAWEEAHTYKDGGTSDRKRLHRRTDGWLNVMAYNLFVDHGRACKDVDLVWYDDEEALDREGCRGTSGRYPQAGEEHDPLSAKLLKALEECPDESTRQALDEILNGGNPPPPSAATEAEGQTPYDRLLEALEERAVEFTKEALLHILTDVQRLVLQTDEQDYPDEEAKLAAFRALEERRGLKPTTRRQHLRRAKIRVHKYVQARMEDYLRGLGLEGPPDAG
jgi:DNA-directed RNA polymerase specialized sigma24 family protein